MDGRTILFNHTSEHYSTIFNQRNGFFARVEDYNHPEPSWAADGPELLDISITNYCTQGCSFCYRNSNPDGGNMPLHDMEFILEQCMGDSKVYQIALGGGNPNQHPEFIKILKLIREADIIPTFTSNGFGLTQDIINATAEYCGAIGISAYPPYEILSKRINLLFAAGIRVNLHIILSRENFNQIISWLENPPGWFNSLNAIIFLNYKPIRKEEGYNNLTEDELKKFFSLIAESDVKIGFDSCSISGVLKWLATPSYFIESCEAAKFSAFISEDLKMYPCSFMINSDWYGNLREMSLMDIWHNSPYFREFRDNSLPDNCKGCEVRNECKGGCHFMPEINLCKKGESRI